MFHPAFVSPRIVAFGQAANHRDWWIRMKLNFIHEITRTSERDARRADSHVTSLQLTFIMVVASLERKVKRAV